MRYKAVVISPHLDDAVFSCGAAIARHVADGRHILIEHLGDCIGQLAWTRHGTSFDGMIMLPGSR